MVLFLPNRKSYCDIHVNSYFNILPSWDTSLIWAVVSSMWSEVWESSPLDSVEHTRADKQSPPRLGELFKDVGTHERTESWTVGMIKCRVKSSKTTATNVHIYSPRVWLVLLYFGTVISQKGCKWRGLTLRWDPIHVIYNSFDNKLKNTKFRKGWPQPSDRSSVHHSWEYESERIGMGEWHTHQINPRNCPSFRYLSITRRPNHPPE